MVESRSGRDTTRHDTTRHDTTRHHNRTLIQLVTVRGNLGRVVAVRSGHSALGSGTFCMHEYAVCTVSGLLIGEYHLGGPRAGGHAKRVRCIDCPRERVLPAQRYSRLCLHRRDHGGVSLTRLPRRLGDELRRHSNRRPLDIVEICPSSCCPHGDDACGAITLAAALTFPTTCS
jgi:hypothetical protein